MKNSSIIILVVVLLVAWRLYFRIRRLVGRQPIHQRRLVSTLILFPVLSALIVVSIFSAARIADPIVMMSYLGGGIIAGVILAIVGLRLTKFEATPEGLFYTPNAYIGVTLIICLVGRIGYRVLQAAGALPGIEQISGPSLGQSPLTLLLFGLVAGYYVAQAAGIMQWKKQHTANSTPPQ